MTRPPLCLVYVFNDLYRHYMYSFCNLISKHHHSTGDIIIKEGEDGDLFYCLEKGNMSV